MPPWLATERIAHLGTQETAALRDFEAAYDGFGSRLCENVARYDCTRNFEACDHVQSKKMQKFVLRSALRPNQISFLHGLGQNLNLPFSRYVSSGQLRTYGRIGLGPGSANCGYCTAANEDNLESPIRSPFRAKQASDRDFLLKNRHSFRIATSVLTIWRTIPRLCEAAFLRKR
jgi:hypothetical protein